MKKLPTILLLALCITLVAGSVFSVALACNGYGSRSYYATTSRVHASLTRCSCTPVDNYLYASTKAQYKSGNNFYWTNWKEVYGYDVQSKSSTTYRSGTVFGYCHFRHQCHTGPSAYTYYQFNVTP